MRCPECMLRAGAGVIFLPGVLEVEAHLDSGAVRVFLAPDATQGEGQLADAVRKQGFTVEAVAARGPG